MAGTPRARSVCAPPGAAVPVPVAMPSAIPGARPRCCRPCVPVPSARLQSPGTAPALPPTPRCLGSDALQSCPGTLWGQGSVTLPRLGPFGCQRVRARIHRRPLPMDSHPSCLARSPAPLGAPARPQCPPCWPHPCRGCPRRPGVLSRLSPGITGLPQVFLCKVCLGCKQERAHVPEEPLQRARVCSERGLCTWRGSGQGSRETPAAPWLGLSPLLSHCPGVPTQGSHIPAVTLGLLPHPWACSALQLSGTVVWALLPTRGCRVPMVVARRAQLWDRHPMAPSLPIPPARAHPGLTQGNHKSQEHPGLIHGLGTSGKPPALGTQQSHPEMCGECRHSWSPGVQGDAEQDIISAGSRVYNPSL